MSLILGSKLLRLSFPSDGMLEPHMATFRDGEMISELGMNDVLIGRFWNL
jgi:hypothetical protein